MDTLGQATVNLQPGIKNTNNGTDALMKEKQLLLTNSGAGLAFILCVSILESSSLIIFWIMFFVLSDFSGFAQEN